jgi:hypothetical protein
MNRPSTAPDRNGRRAASRLGRTALVTALIFSGAAVTDASATASTRPARGASATRTAKAPKPKAYTLILEELNEYGKYVPWLEPTFLVYKKTKTWAFECEGCMTGSYVEKRSGKGAEKRTTTYFTASNGVYFEALTTKTGWYDGFWWYPDGTFFGLWHAERCGYCEHH